MSKQSGKNLTPPLAESDRAPKRNKPSAVAVPIRRYSDQVHAGQLLWSFAVALGLVLTALLQWSAPKNALLEQDRVPAQIRLDLSRSGP
ncbi:MAG: hypothetical protein H7301_09245 [Cryobacterium sp.]|nr:hypothetical protein [Oligoflexia bacterium]